MDTGGERVRVDSKAKLSPPLLSLYDTFSVETLTNITIACTTKFKRV